MEVENGSIIPPQMWEQKIEPLFHMNKIQF